VSYTPNADVHKMFTAWATFNDEGDSLFVGIMKWLYLQDKLNWKKFSEPAPAIGRGIFNVLTLFALLAGKLCRWDKYLVKFN
jgi:hypothetical protein